MSERVKPTALTRAIAARLSVEREQKGINQTDLAKSAGLSQPKVSRLLTGKYAFYIEHFVGICDGLGLDCAEVLATARRAAPR
ncbi:helix-turn-helix domain-containing protein [Oerskovia enterophila]|uniref:Helix-turn-helix domain protein n=1 Tax=Oerskovia enterophila TaxID=43678 RepID=A0A163QUY5_9CELL|nr:helix-turn-helix transcriptional regulator [Oerskovia enterophila]KZM34561.1 helix-turn-helix domain protein [Oerskovia enterophila]